MPDEVGGEQNHDDRVSAAELLPPEKTYYTYAGSLTTPPCSEGVRWLLLAAPIELSADQVAAFTTIYAANNRPVQPRHDRAIGKSK